MSTASTGEPPWGRRRVRALQAGAVSGVDDEVGRAAGLPGPRSAASSTCTRAPLAARSAAAARPSAPLLPLPATTTMRLAVNATEQASGPVGHSRARPADQHLDRLGRSRSTAAISAGTGRYHRTGSQDRYHGQVSRSGHDRAITTAAAAGRGVGQGHEPGPHGPLAGQLGGPAVRTRRGSPLGWRCDLHVGEGKGAQAHAQCLHHCLLGRKARRQRGDRVGQRGGVGPLARVKSRSGRRRPAGEHGPEPSERRATSTRSDRRALTGGPASGATGGAASARRPAGPRRQLRPTNAGPARRPARSAGRSSGPARDLVVETGLGFGHGVDEGGVAALVGL